MSSSYVIFFSSTLLKKKKLFYGFSCIFKKKFLYINHQTLFNHFLIDKKACNNWNYSFKYNTSFFYIYLFFSHIYFVLLSIISKLWIIWFFNIFLSFRSFNILIFELFFCEIIWQIFCKPLHVQAMTFSSNCNTNWSHTRANHTTV